MYIPEYEEQVVHNALQDIEIPFHVYTDEYLPKINRESVFKKFKKNKRSNASVFYNRRKVDMLVAKEKVIIESKYVSKDLQEKEDYLRLLLENKDYKTLSDEFADYRALQLNKSVRKYNIFVPISDKNIATLLLNSIEQGKFYDANKYLNIRKMQEKPMSEELVEIENIMNLCKEISIARYDKKDYLLVQSLIDENESKYPDLLDIQRAKLWIKEKNAKSVDDYKEIDELCQEILDMYPFDGETMAIHAKSKLECGKNEEAMKLYNKAIFNTRNGIIWQKVEDETGISRIDIERDLIEELQNEN